MSYDKSKRLELEMKSEKKGGKGRGKFLQERNEELSVKTSAYKKYLLSETYKNEIRDPNGTHLITAPIIHQMKEFVGDTYNEDPDLKFLSSKPSVKYYENDAISYTSSKNGSSKSSSLSSTSPYNVKEYEDLCKSLKAYRIKSEVASCEDNLKMGNRDIKANNCKGWELKLHDFEDSKFILNPEEFPALK